MLYGPTVIHFHETKCRSALADRAIKTGKGMADDQFIQVAVSLAAREKPCEFHISLSFRWNFILWFVVNALSIFVGFR